MQHRADPVPSAIPARRPLHQFTGSRRQIKLRPARIVQVEALSKHSDQLAAVREAYATLGPQLQALLNEVQSQLSEGA